MSWIKRNLFFVIGSAVALVLMGLAGYFLYSKWHLNNEVWTTLNADYEELKRLNSQNPHPGAGQVNNVKLAQEQKAELTNLVSKTVVFFQPIPRIPDLTNVTDQDFSRALDRTINQLQKAATNLSVTLPHDYGFSFQAQRTKISFATNSLEKLSVQLGEVKTIVDVLLSSKINSLDAIRRERVSSDDSSGPLTDYLIDKPNTNELAALKQTVLLTPYEITFRCFSAELGSVLTGLANSPHGLVVKSVNVEPAPASAMPDAMTPIATAPQAQVMVPVAVQGTAQEDAAAAAASQAAFNRRYGRGGGARNLGGIAARGIGAPPPQQTYVAPIVQPGVAPAARSGLQTVLDEKQLKVTINLVVVKLLPSN